MVAVRIRDDGLIAGFRLFHGTSILRAVTSTGDFRVAPRAVLVEDRLSWMWHLAQETIMSCSASFEVTKGEFAETSRAAECSAGLLDPWVVLLRAWPGAGWRVGGCETKRACQPIRKSDHKRY